MLDSLIGKFLRVSRYVGGFFLCGLMGHIWAPLEIITFLVLVYIWRKRRKADEAAWARRGEYISKCDWYIRRLGYTFSCQKSLEELKTEYASRFR